MIPGDRFKNWVDSTAVSWSDRFKNWLVAVLALPLEILMNVLGKAIAPKLRPFIDSIEASGKVPPEFQPILDELKEPKGQIASMLGYSMVGGLVGGAMGKVIDAFFLPLGYYAMSWRHPVLPTEQQALTAWLRGIMDDETLDRILLGHGADDITRTVYKNLIFGRLDVASVQELWRRDPELYDNLWKDIQDQGIDPARISFLKELSRVIPPLADMVRFADFGAFDPKIIEMWREFYDAPGWIRGPMSKIGITDEWADKYWFSHWRQPGRFELGEMHRRGLINDEIVKNAYLTQGFSSFWQDNLLELVKETWTRVDIQRMWDMRTISEEEMRKAYRAVGYYDEWLEGIVLWTKVYVAFPDLVARWKNGWITEDDVRAELTSLGMPADRVDEMIQTKIKPAQPERTASERELTKSEIVKGVKKEYITWEEGIDLLVDLGYDPSEAEFILSIQVAVATGSPETLPEFKALTQKWRRSVGKEAVPVPEELKTAANDVIRITRELEELNRSIKEEEASLVKEDVLPDAATAQLDELRVTLHRAEASLAEAKSRYDRQLALFHHRPAPPQTP